MNVHLGGEFQLVCAAGSLAAKASNDSDGLVVGNVQGVPTIHKEYLWSVVPIFSRDNRYLGWGIRSSFNGKFIRGNPGMPNGGGVSLVPQGEVDEWAAWGPGTHTGGGQASYVPLILGPKSTPDEICVMTLYGGGGWGPGTQVISYRWGGADNQIWSPIFQYAP